MQLADNPHFQALENQADRMRAVSLADLLAKPDRQAAFVWQLEDLQIDATRQPMTKGVLADLLALAEAASVPEKIAAMLAGEVMNPTENRPALHCQQRHPDRLASREWKKLAELAEEVRQNPEIEAVINLGIGGSDLGPAMVAEALAGHADGPALHFVANIDPAQLQDCLMKCDPRRTLVIVTSKTFTTAETLANAELARDWLVAGGGDSARQMIAVSAAPQQAVAWGVPEERIASFAEGVGGRFSVWSAVGLAVMISIGADKFADFLNGAHQMDRHFASAPLDQNLPVLMALVRIWQRNFMARPSYGIMPYDQRLARLPAWAQQLEMESNGKQVDSQGAPLSLPASPLIWGEPGTNAQHSFFQYLHQGLEIQPIDILLPLSPGPLPLSGRWADNHASLVANAIAQAEALALGHRNDLEPHRHFPGNRPSLLISWDQTGPFSLGRLLALYEHITAVCGFIWDINSFDKWGGELGKAMARQLESGEGLEDFSPAARTLLSRAKQLRTAKKA